MSKGSAAGMGCGSLPVDVPPASPLTELVRFWRGPLCSDPAR
uniref:Uncharacterized protein n=1 Tax=Setaria italica TaxID=4555 RepID=K3ZP77_SETIT